MVVAQRTTKHMQNTTVENVTRCGKVSTQWVLVSPELAQQYLGRNSRNRHLMPTTVIRYASDLTAGFWQITHQGIAFDIDGNLIDGQHRLQAIVDSKQSAWLLITEGLPLEAIEALDRGKMRTLAHTFQIMGHQVTNARAIAVARRMWAGGNRESTKRGVSLTDAYLHRFIDEHLDAILFASSETHDMKTPAAVPAVIARAYRTTALDNLRRFTRAMKDEIPTEELKPGDKSARLVNRLVDQMRAQKMGGFRSQITLYRKTQSALRSFLDGIDLTKLHETKEDLFPLADAAPTENATETTS